MAKDEDANADAAPPRTLGKDLRAIRKSRRLTLEDVSRLLNRSVGWLSQVERDISVPSIADLRQFAKVLDVPMSLLFGEASVPPQERGYIVRAGARRSMGSAAAGLTEELLSPDLTDSFEVIHSSFAPFSRIEQPVRRETQEVGFIIIACHLARSDQGSWRRTGSRNRPECLGRHWHIAALPAHPRPAPSRRSATPRPPWQGKA
jgi:transcriptional regulator with XRE-family HTH domain